MSTWWDEMSRELSKPLTRGQAMRYAWQATQEKLREYSATVYTESYNADQRQELTDHIARIGTAVEEYIALHGDEQAQDS